MPLTITESLEISATVPSTLKMMLLMVGMLLTVCRFSWMLKLS